MAKNTASAYAAQRSPASYPSCVEKQTAATATRPVFVVGCPRSGTTLLYHMILSSGDFAVFPPESGAFAFLGLKFPNLKSLRQRKALLEFWLRSEGFGESGLVRSDIEQPVLEECSNIGDFLRIVMEKMCLKQGVRRWAEKSPTHALFIPEIKRLIPDSLIVHIIRDGRDVALSLSNFGRVQPFLWARGKPLLAFGLYWEWMVRKARFYGNRIGQDYYELHYEDLLRSPEKTLARLGDFIAHDLDYDRILRAGFGSVGRPDSSFHGMAAPGDFKPVGRWKQKCSPRELADFETLVGDELEEVGYSLVTSPQDRKSTLSAVINRAFYASQLKSIHWLRSRRVLRHLVGRRARARAE